MARFDVYPNPDADDRKKVPYFLDVQNSYLEVETRVVVPLHTASRFSGLVRALTPELSVQGTPLIMNTAAIGAIPTAYLRRPVENLASCQNTIQEALDTLFGGY
jgi:toxin CcdB